MRRFILVANSILLVLWLITTIISLMPAHHFDAAALHGIMIIFVLPAFAIGLWGRWLPLGGLTSISLFMTFSIIIASQISS
jgi:hypothetical protein